MKFNLKEYQKQKTKEYFKNNSFILCSINANQKAQNWVITEQELQKLQLKCYKICNKTTKKMMEKSTNINLTTMINSTFFFLKPAINKMIINTKKLQHLNSILFTVLVTKLNKKIYTPSQSKNITAYHYKKNIAILYQFLLTNTKLASMNKK